MEQSLPSRDEAAQMFIDTMVSEYQSVVRHVVASLPDRPDLSPWLPNSSMVKHERGREWFSKLDAEDRRQVESIIRYAVHFAFFQACQISDGYSGGGDGSIAPPLPDADIAEFALYLKIYKDGEAWERDEAMASVRITDNGAGDHLHDGFADAADASETLR